jgi:hypothetical protein
MSEPISWILRRADTPLLDLAPVPPQTITDGCAHTKANKCLARASRRRRKQTEARRRSLQRRGQMLLTGIPAADLAGSRIRSGPRIGAAHRNAPSVQCRWLTEIARPEAEPLLPREFRWPITIAIRGEQISRNRMSPA